MLLSARRAGRAAGAAGVPLGSSLLEGRRVLMEEVVAH